jgi:paraquat-inducible protein B
MSSRRANPALIGGFVLGGIGLLVAALLVFGTFTFFEQTRRFVVFFEGSVDGLTVGSSVLFRGVPLGRVVEVGIRYDPSSSSFEIPVVVELRPSVIARFSPPSGAEGEVMEQLIKAGLRARLESASLVTGQKVVQLNFFPDTPIVIVKSDIKLPQIPALPSQAQQLLSSVDVVAKDLPTLLQTAVATLDRIQSALSPENQAAITATLESTASLVKTLQTVAASLEPMVATADKTLSSLDRLSGRLNGVVEENRPDIAAALRNFRDATVSTRRLLDQLNQIAADNRKPIRQFTEGSLPDLTGLILDARAAVDKAATVLDSIERNPTRFLFGNRTGHGVELK